MVCIGAVFVLLGVCCVEFGEEPDVGVEVGADCELGAGVKVEVEGEGLLGCVVAVAVGMGSGGGGRGLLSRVVA